MLDSLRQDVAYALRGFRRSRGFAAVALLVLAFGIAANTTIFSVVNAVLLRPLPVAQPEGLRFLSVVFTRQVSARGLGLPPRTLEQLGARTDVFSGVAGFFGDSARLGNGLSAAPIVGERVTTDYFDVLGVHAAFGRTFVPADDLPGADPVVVISERFWRTKLDGNPNVLGTTLDMRSAFAYGGTYYRHHRVYTIVGVMAPAFKGISTVWVPSDYWVPLRQRASDLAEERAEISGSVDSPAAADLRIPIWMRAIAVARPRPGVNDASVAAAMHAAEQEMPETEFATAHGLQRDRGTIVPDHSLEGRLPFDPTGKVVPERLAVALMIVPVMVVLIAASNLAGILMARGVARRGEIGVRLALGAGRARVARQMLTESLLLAIGASTLAILLSRALIKVFTLYMPRMGGIGIFSLAAVSLDVPLDFRVLLFTIGLGIATGVFAGMTPALQALRTDILGVLAGTADGASPRSRLRRWIVVPQVCLSIVLLLAAGVLIRALLRAELADRGFNPDGVVYADIAQPPRYSGSMTPEQRQAENARQKAEYLQLLQQVRATAGVEIAALANKAVWTMQDNVPVVSRESLREGLTRWAAGAYVSDGYFEALRLPIVRGRPFDVHDTASSAPVAIVSEDLARLLWPNRDALDEYVASPDRATKAPPTWLHVVGIARQVAFAGHEGQPAPFLYVPIAQQPSLLSASVIARGRGTTPEMLKMLPAAILAAQRDSEVPRARTMAEDISEALYPTRLATTVLGISGLFGLLLSVVGLYGVVSYSAAQRMREIGIRCALGAERRDLLVLLLRDAVVSLAVAVALGVGLGFAAVRVVSSLVVALPRLDVVTMIAVPLLLSVVILAACLRPARRAAAVNPIDVLRAL